MTSLSRRSFAQLLALSGSAALFPRTASLETPETIEALGLTSAPLPILVDPALAQERPEDARRTESMVERLVEEGRANAEARRAQAGRYLLQTLANASAIAREGADTAECRAITARARDSD